MDTIDTLKNTNQEEAKKILRKFSLLSKINYKKLVKFDPEKLWEKLEEAVVYANKVDSNQYLKDALAKRQMKFIQQNWRGKNYPKEYLDDNHKYWKAQNEADKQDCIAGLNQLKEWRQSHIKPGAHANNFKGSFSKMPGGKSMCNYVSADDFKKLNIDTNTLAKMCAYVYVTNALSNATTTSFNEYFNTNRDLTSKYVNRIDEIEAILTMKEFVLTTFGVIFDRLVLECGYNPMILQG